MQFLAAHGGSRCAAPHPAQPAGARYQPVIDLLNVDTGLEKALAVAFGDDLQAALDGDAPIFWRELPEYATALPCPLQSPVRNSSAALTR